MSGDPTHDEAGRFQEFGSGLRLGDPLEQLRCQRGNREGRERGETLGGLAEGWAASAGHAGSHRPAAGSSSSKLGVTAACSSKQRGDWCTRWRDLGEGALARARPCMGRATRMHTSPRPSPPHRGNLAVPPELTHVEAGGGNAGWGSPSSPYQESVRSDHNHG